MSVSFVSLGSVLKSTGDSVLLLVCLRVVFVVSGGFGDAGGGWVGWVDWLDGSGRDLLCRTRGGEGCREKA